MTHNRSSEFGERGEQSLSLRHAMDRLLQDAFVTSTGASGAGQIWPTLDILNTEDAFVVVASLPGVQPDDVEITLENQTLSIRGQIGDESESEQGEYLYRERKFGRFSRQVQFPTRVDPESAEANFANGVLRLRVPKAAETKARRIEIKPPEKHVGSGGG